MGDWFFAPWVGRTSFNTTGGSFEFGLSSGGSWASRGDSDMSSSDADWCLHEYPAGYGGNMLILTGNALLNSFQAHFNYLQSNAQTLSEVECGLHFLFLHDQTLPSGYLPLLESTREHPRYWQDIPWRQREPLSIIWYDQEMDLIFKDLNLNSKKYRRGPARATSASDHAIFSATHGAVGSTPF